MDIVLFPVQSSQISAVGFGKEKDEDTAGVMEVQFTSGKRWRYFGVPQLVYQEMVSASSVGAYFNRAIRSKFPGEQVAS